MRHFYRSDKKAQSVNETKFLNTSCQRVYKHCLYIDKMRVIVNWLDEGNCLLGYNKNAVVSHKALNIQCHFANINMSISDMFKHFTCIFVLWSTYGCGLQIKCYPSLHTTINILPSFKPWKTSVLISSQYVPIYKVYQS